MNYKKPKQDMQAVQEKIGFYNLQVEPNLKELLNFVPPQPIQNQLTYHKYLAILDQCLVIAEDDRYSQVILKAVRNYAQVISLLIGDYENRKFPLPKVSQAELLKFLMEQGDLTQEDLKEELGGQPAVSNILNGKRKLNIRQIEKLSQRFRLNPATFFPHLPSQGVMKKSA